MQTFRAVARTKAFTPGFKLFSGIAVFAFTAAFFFGMSSTGKVVKDNLIDSVVGPITFGWKGDIGNHAGYLVLMMGSLAAAFLAGLLVAFRDADPEAAAELVESDSIPLTRAPYGTSYWPISAAASVALIVLGLVTNMALFWAGIVVLVAVTGVWTFRAWAERATGDDATNMEIYNRFIDPVRLPFTALVCVAIVAIGFSRVALALPSKNATTFAFLIAGVVLFGAMVALAMAPQVFKKLLPAVIVVFGALFIAGGIYGAAKGERDMEHHGGGEGTGAGHGGTEGEPSSGTPAEGSGSHEGGAGPIGATAVEPVTQGAVR